MVTATEYLGKFWQSRSRPAKFLADDNKVYIAKGIHKKDNITDHIVGKLGSLIGAPVPEVEVMQIPSEVRNHQDISHFGSTPAHATVFIDECSDDKEAIANYDVPENRGRFALLAVLYSWTKASDHQFIYYKKAPRLVHSVDHGLFFGGEWTEQALRNDPNDVFMDPVFAPCGLTRDELSFAREQLRGITSDHIDTIVRGVPTEWELTTQTGDVIIQFLNNRKRSLLSHIESL